VTCFPRKKIIGSVSLELLKGGPRIPLYVPDAT